MDYRVFFVSDCSGGMSTEAHQDAKDRLLQAGATPINWVQSSANGPPTSRHDDRQRVNPPVMKYGSMAGLALEYLVAQRDVIPQAS